jgi:hypothetical protein
VLASTAVTTRSHGTLSKNFWMSKSITQSVLQQRRRHASTACSAERLGRSGSPGHFSPGLPQIPA